MNIKTVFKTTNTVANMLMKTHTNNKYDHTGICKLTCADCHEFYIDQTGRSINIRYKVHIGNIKYNKKDPGLATHILRNTNQYWKIDDIMERIVYL
jgi:hypothetical protein